MEYNRDALFGIQNWSERRKLSYAHRRERTSGDVKNKGRIVAIKQILEDRRFDYVYMKEIVVKRQDEQLYKFCEADFPHLYLDDVEDMYLEKVQGRMRGFPTSTQYNFISSLLMYIRQLIIRERVEDLQLGVESYQNHLNLTKPQLMIEELHDASQLMILQQPKFGVTYLNSKNQLRFMRFDELHKFCDVTLQRVRDGLVERLTDDLNKVKEGKHTRWNSSTGEW